MIPEFLIYSSVHTFPRMSKIDAPTIFDDAVFARVSIGLSIGSQMQGPSFCEEAFLPQLLLSFFIPGFREAPVPIAP